MEKIEKKELEIIQKQKNNLNEEEKNKLAQEGTLEIITNTHIDVLLEFLKNETKNK